MKRFALIGVLAVMLFCSACGKQAEPSELTRVIFARGHGSTWGNQFRMEVCPSKITYTHFFVKTEEGRAFKELYDIPMEDTQWKQIETAVMAVLPQLEVQKPPSLLQRLTQALGPKTVDGGAWHTLTATWRVNGEPKDVQYIWTASAEAEALQLLLEELAETLDE